MAERAGAERIAGRRKPHLDDRTCRLICPIAAGMVGVCLTTIGIIRVAIRARHIHTLADDLLAVDAVLFLGAMLSSYFALRVQSVMRHHRLEQIADVCFIIAMVVLTIACFIVTYWVDQ
ncbi:hypothetical protein Q5H91_05430 [Sphingomonas sp. KR1UV-12]|uniref:Uncharacterized protein n=1 Tax=Sphingomonas aurea TaxID=3063994 RepID=A0ABT9EIB2_9SPHN|nr:hypothetical protein [Sphingomonas sp. KR1UV-12]MDP1026644.1 hypothetical protein [Sphingomonas sp. KR1UV-12]